MDAASPGMASQARFFRVWWHRILDAITCWLAAAPQEVATTPESVKLLWQLLAAQALEMALHRCCLLPLPLGRWLFVKFACAKFGQEAVFFDRALEPAHRNFKGLVFFYADYRHFSTTGTL
jgi:hypothetical protein